SAALMARLAQMLALWSVMRHRDGGRFLEPTLQGDDRRAQESSQPDRRDVSALCRRIRRIPPNAEILSTRLWHGECLWLVVGDIVPHFGPLDVIAAPSILFCLLLSSRRLNLVKSNKKLIRMIRTIRKRAPGGGRKPRGQFRGKTATLTTRITP